MYYDVVHLYATAVSSLFSLFALFLVNRFTDLSLTRLFVAQFLIVFYEVGYELSFTMGLHDQHHYGYWLYVFASSMVGHEYAHAISFKALIVTLNLLPLIVAIIKIHQRKKYGLDPLTHFGVDWRNASSAVKLGFQVKSGANSEKKLISVKAASINSQIFITSFFVLLFGYLLAELPFLGDAPIPVSYAVTVFLLVYNYIVLPNRIFEFVIEPTGLYLASGRFIPFSAVNRLAYANPALEREISKPEKSSNSVIVGGTSAAGAALAIGSAGLAAANQASKNVGKSGGINMVLNNYHVAIEAGAEEIILAANLKEKTAKSLFHYLKKYYNLEEM